MWKIVTVHRIISKEPMVFHNVAGVRSRDRVLVVRQGSFPDEKLTFVYLEQLDWYEVAPEMDQRNWSYRAWDYKEHP
jgi:hypothetical protein